MNRSLPLVLLIEDDNDTSVLYQSVLMNDHIQVVSFETGARARRWLADAKRRPDLLIIDVRLPDANGLDLCKEFHGTCCNPPTTPILMLSAHGDPRLPIRCREAGAAEFLDKLVELDDFRNTVRRLLMPTNQPSAVISA